MSQSKSSKILIVEDDPAVLTVVRDVFIKEKYEVMTVSSAREAWALITQQKFDLILLDLGLPDMDGLEFCEHFKKDPVHKETSIFMLTARGTSDEIIRGLEAGAEDYMRKPFNERELVVRARAILRRQLPLSAKSFQIKSGEIKMDPDSHEVWCSDKLIPLTLREFDIFRVFLLNQGKALTREDIVRMAWGPSKAIVQKVVDVHVGHLRVKLGAEGKRIETVTQVGYKFILPKK